MDTPEYEKMQKGIFGRLTGGRRLFALRMAPMIDMIFLLLIFFFVAAKWRPEEKFLPFQIPTAQAQDHSIGRPEPLTLEISATETGCQVRIGLLYTARIDDNTFEADLVVLTEKIKQTLVAQKRYASDPIEITCSNDLKWDHLTKIYNVLYGAGLTDITFLMTE